MSDSPNLVFLLNDHQAYYRHGWDRGPVVQRPRFERLAAEGIAFDRAYTACPLCGPARRTMLTGLFPHTHGEIKNDVNAPYSHELYLEHLAEAGYRTFYYGKWHAGPGTAYDHGCEGFSYPSYNNPYTKPEYRAYLERYGLPEPEVMIEDSLDAWKEGLQEGARYRQRAAWCNEHASGVMLTPNETHEAFFLARLACERLEALARSGDGRPFALRVDFWGPHQPYFPTQVFADLYDPATIPEYGSFRDDLSDKPEIYRTEENLHISRQGKLIQPNPLPWSTWQRILARCYAQVTLVDAAGGLVLDALDRLGLADNTLVIWTTDHGDAVASHGGHFDKRSYMPEEMLRIPMALRWSGHVPAGQRSDSLVSNLDLAPTMLDAAGTAFEGPVAGESLLPLASGEREAWREDLMCETHGHGEDHIGRLIVTDRYKYVANRGQMDELYDLLIDPYEMTNLIDDPACSAIAADMMSRLSAWQARTSDPAEVL